MKHNFAAKALANPIFKAKIVTSKKAALKRGYSKHKPAWKKPA